MSRPDHSLPAFVTSTTLAKVLGSPLNTVHFCQRHRSVHTTTTRRRIRILGHANLYPEPDTPESLENATTPSNPPTNPDQIGGNLKEQINAHQQKRNEGPDSDVIRTPLSTENLAPSTSGPSVNPALASPTPDPIDYTSASKALWRLGWVTWWVQLILTVISAVILLFSFAFPGVNVRNAASAFGFILSGVGVLIAFFSLFWTYSYTRLSLWLGDAVRRTPEIARNRIAGKLRVGLILALLGLVVALLGTQAIVGTLLARLLSSGITTTAYNAYQSSGGLPPGAGVVQPVDILIVQACANSMMALMAALVTTVWLRARAKKWDAKGGV